MTSFSCKTLRVIRLFAVLALLVCTLGACGGEAPRGSAGKTELLVSAAASLTDALNEIQARYEANRPVKIAFNFGASGTLQRQIEQGAPADLFISASSDNMKALVDRGFIGEGEQTDLLANDLVVVVPKDSKTAPRELKDLALTSVARIAVGIPESVPAGSYAKEALVKAQLWEPLQGKIVQAKDVRQVLAYVETGNADAGFVYKTDASTSKQAKIAFTPDPDAYPPVRYPIGIVKAAKHPKEAHELYEYLQSKEAQDIFVRYGFSLPK